MLHQYQSDVVMTESVTFLKLAAQYDSPVFA